MDPRIDIAETEVMVKALRKNGIDAPYIRIPDEGHGWRKLSNQLFYNRRQAEFLLEQLEDRFPAQQTPRLSAESFKGVIRRTGEPHHAPYATPTLAGRGFIFWR